MKENGFSLLKENESRREGWRRAKQKCLQKYI